MRRATALRWAAEEARLRFAPLVAVHAWSFVPPQPIGDPGMLAMPAGDLAGQLERRERRRADRRSTRRVAEALGAEPGSRSSASSSRATPARRSSRESEDAELVVVGSHGRSGLKAALLGSVSRHVVDHAACPVVVVKAQRRR